MINVIVKKEFSYYGEKYNIGTVLKFEDYGTQEDEEVYEKVLGNLYEKDSSNAMFNVDEKFFNEFLEYERITSE